MNEEEIAKDLLNNFILIYGTLITIFFTFFGIWVFNELKNIQKD